MNIDELFSNKRKQEKDFSDESIEKKQQHFSNSGIQKDDNELELALKLLESVESIPQSEYNKQFIIKILHKLQPLLTKNSELRSNYSSSKSSSLVKQQLFDNESELLYEVKNLSELSISLSECSDFIDSYNTLVNNETFILLISLISTHPNIVISRQIIQILNELTEDDEDSHDTKKLHFKHTILGDFLNSCSISTLLLNFINKLDSEDNLEITEFKEESITLVLTFLVNLTSFNNESLIKSCIENNDLNNEIMILATSFKSPSNISIIQQYSMEYLTTLFISTNKYNLIDINIILKTMSGIDLDLIELLLIVYNKFKKYKIDSQSEEYIENAIQLFCHLLSHSINANESFERNEGIDLMLMIIDLNYSNWHVQKSLMILSFAQLTPDSSKLLITNGGLKSLFKNLINKTKPLNSSSLYCLKIINTLFKQLPFESDERLRLLNKFMNKNYSNLKKLILLRNSINNIINDQVEEESLDKPDKLDKLDLYLQLEFQVSLSLTWLIVDDLIDLKLIKTELSQYELNIDEHITDVLVSKITELNNSDLKQEIFMLNELTQLLAGI